jgi:hypothetical protein
MSAIGPTASDVAVQANVGLQVICGSGSRVLETLKMTQRTSPPYPGRLRNWR